MSTTKLTLLDLNLPARSRIESLLEKVWTIPDQHPLAELHGLRLGELTLIALTGGRNRVGSLNFQLFVVDGEGFLAEQPLALGLYNSGPFPGFNWIELYFYSSVPQFADHSIDLASKGLDLQLFQALFGLIPSGGHLMIEYDSPSQRTTERMLAADYPPVLSPIGYLLFQAGCRSFRDWYIAEGGNEGPRKLQGYKPLSEEVATEKTELLKTELSDFLARSQNWDQVETYRGLAQRILEKLGGN